MSDLIGCERAVYARAPDRTARAIAALRELVVSRLVDAGRPDATIDGSVMIRRLAGALTTLFADPAMELDAESADRLMPLAVSLRQMFDIAGGGGLDLILRLLGNAPPGAPFGQLAKRFALLSLDSAFEWPIELVAQAPPRLVEQLLASLIATKPVMTLRGQRRRDELLERAASFPATVFPTGLDHLVLIASAWMLCSYAGSPRKHAIKRRFNERLRQIAAAWRLGDAKLPARRALKRRPLLLFAAEIMHSGHVQFRYFGQYLRQLRTRFELILLTEDKETDQATSALFDRVHTFRRTPDGAYLGEIARTIAKVSPDIIFYPSVGMRHWGPLFANLRLAPIQLTALGHSASTFCDTIDYYLLEEGYVSDPVLFGETVITLPDDSLIFERAPHYQPLPAVVRTEPERLRVAIPSNILKLNPEFLFTLAEIRKQSARRLEFEFMPNSTGLEFDAARKMIGQILPGANVHPQLPYGRYLALLSDCDLNLSPFPFGGLHSVIDSLRQGLPVVAMDCPEPHGRTDAMLLRRLGMPGWLIASDEEAYVAAALKVTGDDALRVALGEQALALDIDRLMFGDATTPLRGEVVDAVWWLYQHHEAVKADGRKLWNAEDRAAFRV